jgi:hypothetical protein
MLKKLRITLGIIALCAFAAWGMLRKPYSPSDNLPRVYYPAFEVAGMDAVSGKRLARTVSTWNGITAAAYNPQSGLLSVACTEGTDEAALIQNLQNKAGTPVSKKIFQEPAGPKCPVPLDIVMQLPHYMLLLGYLTAVLALFTFIPSLVKTHNTVHEKHA